MHQLDWKKPFKISWTVTSTHLSKYLLRMRIKTSDIFYKRYKSCYHRIHISMLGACVIRSGFWWSGSSKLSLMPGSAAASSNQGPCFPSLHPEQSVVISWPWSDQRTEVVFNVFMYNTIWHTHTQRRILEYVTVTNRKQAQLKHGALEWFFCLQTVTRPKPIWWPSLQVQRNAPGCCQLCVIE